ncbi:piwi-like protein Ago3 isoform X2 [Thrips palmi]|uniref:Piwi-like protein Ago3 isoform X2 n=1 Tax=Thrips palmi TaxID=161013 RepID=A0A6P8YLI5_THRPL|nr:piwi-like protein Ago3 isoform X2 [Thrips palmi]
MAGRGGRGLALLEALRKQKEEQPGGTPQEPTAAPTPALPAVAPLPKGRAALFQALAGGARSLPGPPAPAAEPASPASASPAAPAPGGRGSLLASLARGVRPQVETPSSPGSVTSSVEEVTSSTAKLAVSEEREEKPPVIRKGETGKVIKASANFVRLGCEPGKGFFEYEVRFNPECDSKQICFRILNSVSDAFGRVKNFDGVVLYLPIKLPEQTTLIKAKHPVDGSDVTVKIMYKKTRRMGECTHFYNVLLSKIFRVLNFTRMGRQHYNPSASSTIPQHKLEIWPGYVTAIEEYEGGIMLNINASHRVLRQMTCYDVIKEALGRSRDNWQSVVTKDLIGACVLTRYNDKLYRVDDIGFDMSPQDTFPDRGGGETSFVDYYKKQYDITIRDLKQPLLISKEKKKTGPKRGEEAQPDKLICLIPELCNMTGLTDSMRTNFTLMKDIATYTRITPNQRQMALKKFIRSVKENPDAGKVLSDWGLTIEDSTVSFDARVVQSEKIVFGNNKEITVGPKADWSRDATNSAVLTAVDLMAWAIVYVQKDSNIARDFADTLVRVGKQMGIEVVKPTFLPLPSENTNAYVKVLRENIKPPLQLVVTICPSSRDDRYAAIKKITCADMPIASQVINSKTISRPDKLRSIVQKIALQINCKLGGALWAVKIPFDDFMVCGMDVYHDPTRKGASVTGFVASLNQPLTRWFSKVTFQTPGQELVDGLKLCLISALKKYHDVNGKFPDRIMMFRDGVGDGQLKYASEWEIPQLMSCFSIVSPTYSPKLTVVIVQKRINCRIFQQLGGNYDNPPPGTVVDHTVTRRNYYDFFLVSQFSNQGTVTPTHYIVIHDGCQMKVDHVQRIAYKLTHMYYNWPGTVRVPAPCQYAHKLAELVGKSIQKDYSDKLSDRLFFL